MRYHVASLNFEFNCSNVEKITHAFKTAYSRINSPQKTIDLLQSLIPDNQKKYCAWCGKECAKIAFSFKHIDDTTIDFDKVFHDTELNICYSASCDYKKLNPNSVEFISKSRNLSASEALEFLHNRNASPFYAKNHLNKDDYVRYQSARYSSLSKEKQLEVSQKIRKQLSKSEMIKKYR
jgi:hypothetical protein